MGKEKRKNQETDEKKSKKVKKEDEKIEKKEEEKGMDVNFLKENEINLVGDNIPKHIQKFSDLEDFVSSKILKKLKEKKFIEPTLIQKIALPCALQKRDLIAIAETGSGKTLAFMIPALMHIKNNPSKNPLVLCLTPTRELALQIEDHTLAVKSSNVETICLYGGASKQGQIELIKNKKPNIIIGTPGRIIDLLESNELNLSDISYLVFDEADRMLDLGFEPQIRKILSYVKKKAGERQTLMFSATWPVEVERIASDFLSNPIKITKGSNELSANKRVTQTVHVIDRNKKIDKLLEVLKENSKEKTILFGLYKKSVDFLEGFLSKKGYGKDLAVIHGDKNQTAREEAINLFHKGKKRILLTTDVCARGMDIKHVTLIINYEYPLTTEDYVHRIGRTARNKEVGTAITLFDPVENAPLSRELVDVLKDADQPIPEELQKIADKTYARPQRSYLDKLYGGKYEYKTQEKAKHIKF